MLDGCQFKVGDCVVSRPNGLREFRGQVISIAKPGFVDGYFITIHVHDHLDVMVSDRWCKHIECEGDNNEENSNASSGNVDPGGVVPGVHNVGAGGWSY